MLKTGIAKIAMALLGRSFVSRCGRFFYNEANYIGHNQIQNNGELLIQRCVIENRKLHDNFVAFDIGANVGEWSIALVNNLRSRQSLGRIHAFEPFAATYQSLVANIELASANEMITPQNFGIADDDGERSFFTLGANIGQNSFLPVTGSEAKTTSVIVKTKNFIQYCQESGIQNIDLIKIDTEGFDFSILHSMKPIFDAKRVRVVQFEYNIRWIESRHFLRDVFRLVQPLGYAVGKVTPDGVEYYDQWDEELEHFREGNYVVVDQQSSAIFPIVRWWKS